MARSLRGTKGKFKFEEYHPYYLSEYLPALEGVEVEPKNVSNFRLKLLDINGLEKFLATHCTGRKCWYLEARFGHVKKEYP